ncbi:phosphate ABC transporter substrate-binding protein PstS [Microbacterium sp. SORGH_AS_0888]|uniref:phosphate ABC transporter substrate-binding protein PstS n=1 Tax=Microbacterium sp. SORGH_AS_0888 TaxID=3041791 RepID=UPI00278BAAF9|nr:phosphate ABC transporter substrate-binding protein PstS [Microbacterium sp. SORGH_AS_0888]MDQ1129041.1 phosphate transport system substrate-binding protein [Microbacterium sp. SORGH_AS_0888]
MNRRPHRILRGAIVAFLLAGVVTGVTVPAHADSYVAIAGSGSTWSQNALDQWRRNVASNYGMTVNYSGNGSSAGRSDFINGTVDFAISEIPFQTQSTPDNPVPENPPRGYAYLPIVAGGTSLMYNVKVAGKQVTSLQLSGETIARIFAGQITKWNDPAITGANPGLDLPEKQITPVVRSDGSGSTAQFTKWMSTQYPSVSSSILPNGMTSYFPANRLPNSKAQSGSLGVSGYVAQGYGEGSITYVEYSYALKSGFPVVSVQNPAGNYVQPTASNVAIALTRARINEDSSSPDYLTQILDDVYNNGDPSSYPISSYSYMIVPTAPGGIFTAQKGATLGAFLKYVLCDGQDQAGPLGYSPLPMNLVTAAFAQIKRVPGSNVGDFDANTCTNTGAAPDGAAGGNGAGGAGGGEAAAATATAAAGVAAGTGDAVYDANGNLVSGSGAGAAATSSRFALASHAWGPAQVGMAIAGIMLLAVVVLPPLLLRRAKR